MTRNLSVLLFAAAILSGRADDNLLKNGNFEKRAGQAPQGWEKFSDDKNKWHGTLSKEDASQGGTSVSFRNASKKVAFQGLFQPVRVKPGQTYMFSIFIANDPAHPLTGSSRGQLSIEWYDSQDKEISRDWSRAWGAHASKEKWVRFAMTGVAPARAVRGSFVITLFSEGETTGGFLVDDASLTKVN